MARRGQETWRWGARHSGGRPTIAVIERPKGLPPKGEWPPHTRRVSFGFARALDVVPVVPERDWTVEL